MLRRMFVAISVIIIPALLFMGFHGSLNAGEIEIVENSNSAVLASGSVSGIIKFDDNYPKTKRIRVSKDNEICGNIKKSKQFIVNRENKGLKNVLVTIEGVKGGKKPSPVEAISVEQTGCSYSPHFQVAELGADGIKLTVINKDGILHNIHSYLGKKTLFNVAQPKYKKRLSKKLTEPGVVKFKCDVHNWMEAYVVVLKDQPYYSVTDVDGRFSIDGIPPGTYTVKAWHEALGNMEKTVEIASDAIAELDFVIKPKSK